MNRILWSVCILLFGLCFFSSCLNSETSSDHKELKETLESPLGFIEFTHIIPLVNLCFSKPLLPLYRLDYSGNK